MPQYAAYIRISRLRDGDHSTAAEQRAKITSWMRDHHPAAVLRWYEDLDQSGRTEDRPAWQRLLHDLEHDNLSGVVVFNYTKTHRRVRDYLAFYDDILQPRGQALIDISTPHLNLSSADGRMQATIFAAVAEHHANKTSELMTATLRHIKQQEGRTGGRPPFGCERDPDTLHLIPAPTLYLLRGPDARPWIDPPPNGWQPRRYYDSLRTLYTTYSGPDILSGTEAAAKLNQTGWRFWQRDRRTPCPWNRDRVRRCVSRSALYASGPQPDGWTAQHDPIIDPALCEAVAARVALRSPERVSHNRRSGVYLLTGLIYCAGCGQRLYGSRHVNGWRYYQHDGQPPACPEPYTAAASDCEQTVMAEIEQLAERISPAMLADLLGPLLASPAKPRQPDRLHDARIEAERLIDLHIKGLITQAQFIRRHDPLQAEIDRLEQKQASHPSSEQLAQNIEQLLSPAPDPLAQRDLVRLCVQRVEIRDRQADQITWRDWIAAL